MPVIAKIPRSLVPFVVIVLGWYGIKEFFKLIGWLIPSTQSRDFGLWLFLAGPTLLAIGAVILGLLLLVNAAGKRAAASSTDAFATQLGKALGDCLTRYQSKHNAPTQHTTLGVNLADFERALTRKLPEAAYQQRSWWTDESAHSQQWLAQGWQVLDTQLTEANPHVVFGLVPQGLR
ncbi:MAG: DUF7662 domain-containing protein [Janthinobacterium lividum]